MRHMRRIHWSQTRHRRANATGSVPGLPDGRAHPPANHRTRSSRQPPNDAQWTLPRTGSVPSTYRISCRPLGNAGMSSRDRVSILMPPIGTEPSLEWRSTTCLMTKIPEDSSETARNAANSPEPCHNGRIPARGSRKFTTCYQRVKGLLPGTMKLQKGIWRPGSLD